MDHILLNKVNAIGLDPQQQIKTLHYFEELKSSEFGWRLCIQSLSSNSWGNEHAYFFALQVIEHHVKNRHSTASTQDQELVRNFLCQWAALQISTTSSAVEHVFIRNKVAQIAALTFIEDFPTRWPSFFSDLQSTLQTGDVAVDYYLRVLSAVDSEIADREISRTNQEVQRNNVIKDAMRQSAILSLVDSWYRILTTFMDRSPCIASQCLQVIGSYILWIDISSIANDRFVPILVKLLSLLDVREAAADCIQSIVSKGMDPLIKANLIESFSTVLDKAGVWQSFQNGADSEYVIKLGSLLNVLGVSLIETFNILSKGAEFKKSDSFSALILGIEHKVDLMLQCLGNSNDDVSSSVLEFARDYLHFLKLRVLLSETGIHHYDKLLVVVSNKLRYDYSYNFEQEGENEALFLEYRKELRTIMDNLILIDSEKVINYVLKIVEYTIPNWRKLSFEDVEAALFLLYMIGESAPVQRGITNGHSEIQAMCVQLTNSGVQCYPHPIVVLQYFETVVRYEKFYMGRSDLILPIMTAFLKENGLFHPSKKVRSRTVYLFSRFVKSIRAHLSPVLTREILLAVQCLLRITSPLRDANLELMLSDDDQLYIFEVVGFVIVSGERESQKRSAYMREVILPLLEACKNINEQLTVEEDSSQKNKLASMIVQTISVTGRLSKAFSSQLTMKSCDCGGIFLEALQVFLQCLDVMTGDQEIVVQSVVRQYLHRLVVCLQEEILPYIPVASYCLVKNFDSKAVVEYIPLINQVINKFKKEISPFLRQVFGPMVQAIFNSLAQPFDVLDENAVRDRQLLQMQYFRFIAVIVSNNLTEVLESQGPVIMQQVMESIIQGSMDFPDPSGQIVCFTILRKLVDQWGVQAGPEGFVNFIYKNIVPACFIAPTKNSFDVNDAQTSLVVNETSMCLKSILEKRQEEFIIYLQNHYLPTLDLSPQKIIDYVQALQGPAKEFKLFLKTFFQRKDSQNR